MMYLSTKQVHLTHSIRKPQNLKDKIYGLKVQNCHLNKKCDVKFIFNSLYELVLRTTLAKNKYSCWPLLA